MRWPSMILLLACGTLGAEGPFRVVAVVRRGPPPYEPAGRIYRLDGGLARGLRAGARLAVRREGTRSPLGHLKVVAVREGEAEATFTSAGGQPMKGDTAWPVVLEALPALSGPPPDPPPFPSAPRLVPEAPPREGLLYFLPQRADLSPAGRQKLRAWVRSWGVGGRWMVQVPAGQALSPSLQAQRAGALLEALRALGVEAVVLETRPRPAEGTFDPVWVRHWD